MKRSRRRTRIFILSLLSVSVLPIFLLSNKLRNFNSKASEEYIEDLSRIKYRTDALKLSAIHEDEDELLKEPPLLVYKDGDFGSEVTSTSSNGNISFGQSDNAKTSLYTSRRNGSNQDAKQDYQQIHLENRSLEQSEQTTVQRGQNIRAKTRRVLDEKVKEIKDQLIRAKVYLKFAPPTSNSHLVRELKLRLKELERAVGDSRKDSDLSGGALHRMRAMESTLSKASRVYTDCHAIANKLRAMTYNAEEQARAQNSEVAFLLHLAGRTTPKGLHCLSMRLTAEYFALKPEEWQFPNQHKLQDPDLYYHFAVFSDNILACAVVVNSTISTSTEPEKIVFHLVTDSLNLPALSMWFLLNPPGKSAMHIQSIDSFEWLLHKQNSHDRRYTSSSSSSSSAAMNHLRFYMPDVFPMLNKIVLLDHDVVVQRDLTGLWNVSMKGKVNGAVETCRMVNISGPRIEKRCTWAFGMSVFDLREWRNQRPLWRAGSLPTFYNHTVALDRTWHVLVGLGYNSAVSRVDIEQATVIHFDGIRKPWLDIGLDKYKEYWKRHVNYQHSDLQLCNIH